MSTPSNPMDCSLPGSSIRGICQARVLEWVATKLYKSDLLVAETETQSEHFREKPNFLEGSCYHEKVIDAARLKRNIETRNLIFIRVPLYLLSHTISAHFSPHETIHI